MLKRQTRSISVNQLLQILYFRLIKLLIIPYQVLSFAFNKIKPGIILVFWSLWLKQ